MTDEKLELDLEEPESLELEPTTPSGNIIVIPPDVIRTVSELPSDPEIGTVVALVSDDESKVNGFYVATEKTEEGTVWTLYVTSGIGEIADKSVTERKIAYNSINRFHIQEGAVEAKHIAANAVDKDALGEYSVGDGHICDGAVQERHILKDAVTTDKIKDKSITKDKLDDEAFKALTVAENSIGTKHLQMYSVTEEKIAHNSVGSSQIKEGAVGTPKLRDRAVTDEKIQNKTISKGKMAFDVATEDFVRNSIRNISGGKPLIGDVVSILDEFEGYEIHQVVKTTDLISKSWSNVKIWSADDGITATDTNPFNFDFSQLSETNYTKTSILPTQIDFSSIEGRNIICSLIFQDEEIKKFMCIQLHQPTGSNAMLQLIFYNGDEDAYYNAFYTTEGGWINESGGQLTENDLMFYETTFPSLKIVDFASLHKDNPEVAPEGVEVSPEFLLDIFLKDWIQVYYPMGYYLTDKSSDSIPKSWAEVQRLVRSGQASRVFNIGDQLICAKDGVAHVWDVIGIDYDTPLNPNYTHSITLQLNTAFESAAFDSDSNDYSSSDIRAHLNGDYLTGFDEDFLSVIGGIRKPELLYNTDEESTEDDIYPGSDIFFLLSAEEVSTNPYEYYSTAETDPTIRVKTLGTTTLCNWRLRSADLSGGAGSATDIVATNGNISTGSITRTSFCLAPACVIY